MREMRLIRPSKFYLQGKLDVLQNRFTGLERSTAGKFEYVNSTISGLMTTSEDRRNILDILVQSLQDNDASDRRMQKSIENLSKRVQHFVRNLVKMKNLPGDVQELERQLNEIRQEIENLDKNS